MKSEKRVSAAEKEARSSLVKNNFRREVSGSTISHSYDLSTH